MSSDKITVFIVLRKETRVCEYGDKHTVSICTRKFLYPTGQTWVHDNGYEKRVQPVFRDAQGREWRKCVNIDYSNNVYYASTGLPSGYTSLPYNGIEERNDVH